MFVLFWSLYYAMFTGTWRNVAFSTITETIRPIINGLGEFLTSIFNNVDTPMTTLGDIFTQSVSINGQGYVCWIGLIAFVLALITSIGIVVVAVKGIKRLFTVFFYGVR